MAHRFSAALVFLAAVSLQAQQTPSEPSPEQKEGFRFKSGVELVNVTATVTDLGGRFVSGLTRDDFTVYEDNLPQTVTHFGADRVPVSLGIVLDTSGSMEGSKIRAARAALEQFLEELRDPQDEFFLYQFSDAPILLQGWTTDRRDISRALSHIAADGGTALFEAVARAVPLVATGRNSKKALVLISDGNDSSGRTRADDVQRLIRETDVLVYAIGIDGDEGAPPPQRPPMPPPPRFPGPMPFPRRPGGLRFSQWQWPGPQGTQVPRSRRRDEHVNAPTLRNLTDDSGGRTEIIREARDLRAATSGIADELSQQYYLGYPASGKKDGRWHAIRVEVRNGKYRVRARRGYMAS